MADEIKLETMPTPALTLDPFDEKRITATEEPKDAEPVTLDQSMLTPEEQAMVDNFAATIDVTDSQVVLQYGAAAQSKISSFSENALNSVRTKDMGEIGEMLTGLVTELRGFDAQESKGFFGLFKKSANKLKAQYDDAAKNVEKICTALESHQVQLMKDIAMLDEMYKLNLTYFKELSMYILAGKKKLEEVRTTVLPPLQEKAKASGLPEDAQAAKDMDDMCNRFEKKLHDLELTRIISIQMAPQIRLVQSNDTMMTEKIQSTLVNTIPLWKSQMVLALGLEHSRQAMEAQRQVSDMTNELLKKNAEALKTSTIETAKESERGIVDMETLKQTNESLISTLDEVLRIQDEGRQRRREAETEIGRLEGELKQKLLELHNGKPEQQV